MPPLPAGSLISEVGETAGIVAIFILAALGAVALIGYAVNEAVQKAVKKTRETIYKERKTGVPALFTFIGAGGAAATNVVVSPPVGAFVAIALAAIAFVSTSLADDCRQNKLAFKVAIAGCILPVLAFTIAALVSGGFADAGLEKKALVVGALLLVWVGVGLAVVLLRDRSLPELRPNQV